MTKKFGKAFKKVKKINNKIKKYTKEKYLGFLINEFSNTFKIPKYVIEKKQNK